MEFERMKQSHSQFDFWQNITQGIDCLYRAALFDRWSMFTDKVATITHSDQVSLSLINQKTAELLLYSSKSKDNHPLATDVNKKAHDEETIALRQCVRLCPETSTPATVLPRHCYYCQENILVEDVAYQMLFLVNKCEQKPIYKDTELASLLCLLPYLITTLTALTTHKYSLNRLDVLQQTIEQGSKGIILCDHQEKIIFVNQFMQSHLIKNDFMQIVNNDLVLTKQDENIRYHQLLRQVSAQPLADTNSLTLDNENGSHALISIAPLAKKILCNSDVATTMVTVNFEQLINWSLFSHEYQLTKKELILLKTLYQNKKLNELPDKLGVTVNTLRTHLQSIFHKTQTNSQIELMIRLSMYKL